MAWSREEAIPRSEMRQIQLGRLQKTVRYVHEGNAVYRKKLDELGVAPGDVKSLDDIRLMQDFGSTVVTSTPSFLMHLHEVEVRIEVTDDFMAKAAADILEGSEQEILKDMATARRKMENLRRDIKDMIGITVKVTLVPPGTIPRSDGKARRVEDKRPRQICSPRA